MFGAPSLSNRPIAVDPPINTKKYSFRAFAFARRAIAANDRPAIPAELRQREISSGESVQPAFPLRRRVIR